MRRPSGADEVAVRPVASALNHMDLWLTRGQPRPALPARARAATWPASSRRSGRPSTGWAVGDEVVVNPAVAPVEAIVAYGDDSPLGRGFQILGEQRWGGHAERVVVPARNLVARPANRTWEECAAYPLATLTAWRMLKRARLAAGERCLIVGIGGGVSTAALHLAVRMGAEVHVTSRDAAKRDAARRARRRRRPTTRTRTGPSAADVVVESVGPATWERSIRALVRRRPAGRVRRHLGPEGGARPARASSSSRSR